MGWVFFLFACVESVHMLNLQHWTLKKSHQEHYLPSTNQPFVISKGVRLPLPVCCAAVCPRRSVPL